MEHDPPTRAQQDAARPGSPSRVGPHLPRPIQFVLVGAFLILLVLLFAGGAVVQRLLGRSEPAPATAEATPQSAGAGFKPTDRQWATLKIQTVQDQVFQPAAETDGKIALPGPHPRDPAHLPRADAPGADDLCRRLCRTAARRGVERNRIAGTEAAGPGGGGRNHVGTRADPGHPAGIDRHILPPPIA
jgi:hypothetical protein